MASAPHGTSTVPRRALAPANGRPAGDPPASSDPDLKIVPPGEKEIARSAAQTPSKTPTKTPTKTPKTIKDNGENAPAGRRSTRAKRATQHYRPDSPPAAEGAADGATDAAAMAPDGAHGRAAGMDPDDQKRVLDTRLAHDEQRNEDHNNEDEYMEEDDEHDQDYSPGAGASDLIEVDSASTDKNKDPGAAAGRRKLDTNPFQALADLGDEEPIGRVLNFGAATDASAAAEPDSPGDVTAIPALDPR